MIIPAFTKKASSSFTKLFSSYPALFLFLFTFLSRFIYVMAVHDPNLLNRWLPHELDQRGLMIMNGLKHSFMTAWGSYPLLLAPVYRLLKMTGLLEHRLLVIEVLNCLAAAFSVVIFYRLSVLLFGEKDSNISTPKLNRLCFASALAFALYYPLIYFNALNLTENLFILLILLIFYLSFKPVLEPASQARLLGALCALSAAIRPIALPFVLFLFLWLAWQSQKKLRFFLSRRGINLILVFILTLASFSLINSRFEVHKTPGISGNGGVNFAIAWCEPKRIRYKMPGGESFWFLPPAFQAKSDTEKIQTQVPFHNQTYYYKMGFNCLAQYPERIVTGFHRVLKIFHSRFYPDRLKSPLHKTLLYFWKWLAIPWLCLFFLFPFLEKDKREPWNLGAALLLSLIVSVYINGVGEERYLTTYYFIFFLWGLPAAGNLWRRSVEGKRHLKIALSGGSLIFFALCFCFYQARVFELEHYPGQTGQPPRLLSKSEIRKAYHESSRWVARSLNQDGSFYYSIAADTLARNNHHNLVRQFLTSQGLALAARYWKEPALVKAHYQNLEYLIRHIRFSDAVAYIQSSPKKPAEINETAFAVLALLDSPFRKKFTSQIKQMGAFLLRMQQKNGRFYALYPFKDNLNLKRKDFENRENFFAGETMLVCGRLYRAYRSPEYLTCAEKAFRYYAPVARKKQNASMDSWFAIAAAELYELTGNPVYLKALNQAAERLLKLQLPSGLFKGMQMSSQAVFLEAIWAAIKVNCKTQPVTAKRFLMGYQKGMAYLIGMQFPAGGGCLGCTAFSPKIIGGILSKSGGKNQEIRIDNNGHSLSMFYGYFRPQSRLSSDQNRCIQE